MHITDLRLRNFRNFRRAHMRFAPGVNTLLGENGAGKSNALHALRLVLDEGMRRSAVRLRESDFCRQVGDWRGHWITVSVCFAGFTENALHQLVKHKMAYMDGSDTGAITLVFRPKVEVRRALFEVSGKGLDEIHPVRDAVTIDDYEVMLFGRGTADFADDDVYREIAGDFAGGSFADPDTEDAALLGIKTPAIYDDVACTFVRALRDVVADLRGVGGNPLLALLRGVETTLDAADASSLEKQVANLNEGISNLKEIKGLAQGIELRLAKTVGQTYGPSISIESTLPSSLERLMQHLTVLVGDDPADRNGEVWEQSLGVANLLFLALKLMEYDGKKAHEKAAHFLLIEEPEAHVHTHIQRALFQNLEEGSTQVIVTSHSTHVASVARVSAATILAKVAGAAEAYNPTSGLTDLEVTRLERYLDAVRSTMLFAKGVLLVEGDAELILLPALMKAAFGVIPDECGFSVISVDSTVFEHVAQLFHKNRIHRPCAILTDLDVPVAVRTIGGVRDLVLHPIESAEVLGLERRKVLDLSASENSCVRPFYAPSTFEAELRIAGIVQPFVDALEEVYVSVDHAAAAAAKLRDTDLAIAADEALRLAKKAGKGWFAVNLASRLSAATAVPDYVLEAIAFACSKSLDARLFARMVEHRVTHGLVIGVDGVGITDWKRVARPTDYLTLCAPDVLSRLWKSAQAAEL